MDVDDTNWARPTLEYDIASMNGSDDKQKPSYREFNEKIDMRNVKLKKGMEFQISKVFRKATREYVIHKHVNIKFKLNENKKIFVYCKNECG